MSGSEAEDEVIISLKVKTTTQAYDISVKSTASISSVKDILTTVVENATKEQLCLIFSGKILKDHETLKMHILRIRYAKLLGVSKHNVFSSSNNLICFSDFYIYNIGDGMAIHLVVRQGQTRRSPNQTTSNQHEVNNTRQETRSNTGSSIFSGVGGIPQLEQGGAGMQVISLKFLEQIMNNPEIMRQMMDSPIMQNIMGNPDVFRSILANNPQIQQLVERNPELGHVLNDPDMMRQTMEMIRNPNMFQEMMRSHDLAIRNLQGIPGGEAALQRLYQDVQEPLLNSATSSLAGNPFASLRQTENNSCSVARRPDGIGCGFVLLFCRYFSVLIYSPFLRS
uniref:Ubiquitin-like domain-containing protein n=1 Tax=Heterorhabditis bacteriophora TaxID=37862 RepID=A0A1I7WX79_HETBA